MTAPATKSQKRVPVAETPPAVALPFAFSGGVDEVHLEITGKQTLPKGHPSENKAFSVYVTLEHSTECDMDVKFIMEETRSGKYQQKEGKIQIEPDMLPLLAATLSEAARQFEARGLRHFIMENYE